MTHSQTRPAIDKERVESLMFPVVTFLRMSGLTKEAMETALGSTYERVSKSIRRREIKCIGGATRYADIVSVWTHNERFLDAKGQPKPLPLQGKNGFLALVRSAAPKADPLATLNVLKRFKTIRRDKRGDYKLVKPFFISTTAEKVALEPVMQFLVDVTTTIARILTRARQSRSPDVFWRNVDNHKLSLTNTKKFIAFSRERTLTFLEELDDWLEAHSERKTTNKHLYYRAGLGIFSIHSPPRSQ